MFTVYNTNLQGLKLIQTDNFIDNRGKFQKLFSKDEFKKLGLDTDFKEFYYSVNKKSIIRGMHFQTPSNDHIKLVYVIQGSIIDVCIDLRKSSFSYGKYFETPLTNDGTYLYIPKGFAHGFLSRENNTIVHYAQTTCYSKEHDTGILYNSFGYNWKVENPIISERDLSFVTLDNFETPFK